MSDDDRRRWDARYSEGDAPIRGVNGWLAVHSSLLRPVEDLSAQPPQAIDIACGAGGTLSWLAGRGWRVTGVDVSPAALALAQAHLAATDLLERATLIEADLDAWRPLPGSCDLLTCFYFLDRRLWPSLRAAVRPGGLICLSTFHAGRLASHPHTDPAHLLRPDEYAALIHTWGWLPLAAQTTAQTESILAQRPPPDLLDTQP